MHHLKHFIFDFSGTLFNDHKPSFLATQETISYFSGKAITFESYKNDFNIPVHDFYYEYIGDHVSVKEIDTHYFQTFTKYMQQGTCFEGVKDSFRILKEQGKSIGVFSTVKQDMLEEMLNALNLRDDIDIVYGSVFDKVKEFSNYFQNCAHNPEESLYIGDMNHDVLAAQKNGLVSGAVASGYHSLEKLTQAKPRFLWQHPKQWPSFFESLKQKRAQKIAKDYPVATVGALILNPQGECLLVLTDKWQFCYGIPGGKIEKNETRIQALEREIFEETQLKIKDIKFFMMQDFLDSEEFYIPNSHFLLLNYLVQTEQTKVNLNNEAQSYLWIEPELALNLKLNTPTRTLIEEFLKLFHFQKP